VFLTTQWKIWIMAFFCVVFMTILILLLIFWNKIRSWNRHLAELERKKEQYGNYNNEGGDIEINS
jgi:hypothetical protein